MLLDKFFIINEMASAHHKWKIICGSVFLKTSNFIFRISRIRVKYFSDDSGKLLLEYLKFTRIARKIKLLVFEKPENHFTQTRLARKISGFLRVKFIFGSRCRTMDQVKIQDTGLISHWCNNNKNIFAHEIDFSLKNVSFENTFCLKNLFKINIPKHCSLFVCFYLS